MRRDAVDRGDLAFGVDIPNDPAVVARIGAKPPVEPAREYHAGDRGDGGGLRGAASRDIAAAGVRRPPNLFSGLQLQRQQTAARFAVQEKRQAWIARHGLRAWGSRGNHVDFDVGHGDVDIVLIRRDAPLHAAELAAVSDPLLPDDLAGAIGIERGHDAGFLAGDQDALAAGKIGEDCRRSEIVVGPVRLRAIRPRRRTASDVEGVARRHLAGPSQLARARVEREDGVGGRARRVGVIVAGGRVDPSVRRVECRRRPDRRARRSHQLHALGIDRARLGGFGDRVCLPEHFACRGLQRDRAAAEGATRIVRVGPGDFFVGRYRHEQGLAHQRRRAGDDRCGVLIDPGRPKLFAGDSVDRMDVAALIAEIGRPAARARTDDDGRSHRPAIVVLPVHASALRIERIDFSALAADEYSPAHYGRLGDRADRAGKPEGPFQFEARYVVRGQPRHLRRLKPMLRGIDAPSVPMRRVQRIDEGRAFVGAGAGVGLGRSGFLRLGVDRGGQVERACESENRRYPPVPNFHDARLPLLVARST